MADDLYEVGFGKPLKAHSISQGPIRKSEGATKGSKNIIVLVRKTLEEKVIVKGPGGTHSMATLNALIMQLANKAMSGGIKSLREKSRLIEKLQEQEPYLNAPEFVVNFIDPPNRKPSGEEDGEK